MRDAAPDRTSAGDEAGAGRGRNRGDRRERILDVAERLFAERGYSNVSVRDIAVAADVTHPLIYYYWTSKDGLLEAAMARAQRRIREIPPEVDRLETVVAMARETLEHNRHYLLTLTRTLLDGLPPSEWPGGFPAVEATLELVPSGLPADQEADARARVGATVAMVYGWVLMEDALLDMVGLTPADRERARDVLLRALGEVLTPALDDR